MTNKKIPLFLLNESKINELELLLKDPNADPSAYDNFAIRYAAKNGHLKIVELLLKDLRVDPTADNNFAIRIAAVHYNYKIIKLLLNDLRVLNSLSFEIIKIYNLVEVLLHHFKLNTEEELEQYLKCI
jgi:hypothetical protein